MSIWRRVRLTKDFSLSHPHVVNIDHSENARMIGSRISTCSRPHGTHRPHAALRRVHAIHMRWACTHWAHKQRESTQAGV